MGGRASASPARSGGATSQSRALRQNGSRFRFDRDTLAFANWTVWNYHGGRHVVDTRPGHQRTDRYTRRCFVMSRTAQQFHKFARFEPHAPPLDDAELIRRVRRVTAIPPWRAAYSPNERIVFPGYPNLRAMSKARTHAMQENIGIGWPTYLRVGNARMVFQHSIAYQEATRRQIDETLARGDLFVGFLSDFPTLHINHAVLVYGRDKAAASANVDTYLCYDPNHPEGPRHLTWSRAKHAFAFEKDPEFAGGFTRVFQIYGKPLQ